MTQTVNPDAQPIAVRDELNRIARDLEPLIARLDRIELAEAETKAAAEASGLTPSLAALKAERLAEPVGEAGGYLRKAVEKVITARTRAGLLSDQCYEATKGRGL